jgi:hypothetical protein
MMPPPLLQPQTPNMQQQQHMQQQAMHQQQYTRASPPQQLNAQYSVEEFSHDLHKSSQ